VTHFYLGNSEKSLFVRSTASEKLLDFNTSTNVFGSALNLLKIMRRNRRTLSVYKSYTMLISDARYCNMYTYCKSGILLCDWFNDLASPPDWSQPPAHQPSNSVLYNACTVTKRSFSYQDPVIDKGHSLHTHNR
jgi:poly(A) polymerase Pap1